MNIVFMGSPEFSVKPLEALVNSEFNVDLVVSQEDKRRNRNRFEATPVKKFAIENNIEVITPKKLNSDEAFEKIKAINPDFIVVIAYGQLIGKKYLEYFNNRIINVHASLLPKYRGAAPINWAILNGDEYTGLTSMLIEKGLDSGDMLEKRKIKINIDDDVISITRKLSELSSEIILSTLRNFDYLFKNRIKQGDDYTLAPKLTKEMGEIDFNKSMDNIFNQVRALKAWPISYTFFEDKKVKIFDVVKIENSSNYNNGQIIDIDDETIIVKCQDGAIGIKELQFPNKKRMMVKDYLLGNRLNLERLGR